MFLHPSSTNVLREPSSYLLPGSQARLTVGGREGGRHTAVGLSWEIKHLAYCNTRFIHTCQALIINHHQPRFQPLHYCWWWVDRIQPESASLFVLSCQLIVTDCVKPYLAWQWAMALTRATTDLGPEYSMIGFRGNWGLIHEHHINDLKVIVWVMWRCIIPSCNEAN